jgi:predicted nucleotidyltransferase
MNFDLEVIVRTLGEHQVEFILVGGVAAAVQGAPIVTQDVNIVYRIEEKNIQRLKSALVALDAVARDDPRRLRFDESHLRTRGHKPTMTQAGPLDVLGTINEELTFEDLYPDAEAMRFGELDVLVLRLEKLVELKRNLKRPKDIAMLPVLEATLRERSRPKS